MLFTCCLYYDLQGFMLSGFYNEPVALKTMIVAAALILHHRLGLGCSE